MARLELPEYLKKLCGWTNKTSDQLLDLFGLARSTYFGWFDDGGELIPPKNRMHKHSKKVLDEEIKAVLVYRELHRDIGYRKLTDKKGDLHHWVM